jgi:hypothetical protein
MFDELATTKTLCCPCNAAPDSLTSASIYVGSGDQVSQYTRHHASNYDTGAKNIKRPKVIASFIIHPVAPSKKKILP